MIRAIALAAPLRVLPALACARSESPESARELSQRQRDSVIGIADDVNIMAFDSPRPIVREALDRPEEEVGRVVAMLRRKSGPGV